MKLISTRYVFSGAKHDFRLFLPFVACSRNLLVSGQVLYKNPFVIGLGASPVFAERLSCASHGIFPPSHDALLEYFCPVCQLLVMVIRRDLFISSMLTLSQS